MEPKVYRARKKPGRWLNLLILFVSAMLVAAGLLDRQALRQRDLRVEAAATAAPTPLSEAYDDTPEQRELRLPEVSWYAIQLAAFDNAEGARAVAEGYQARGAAGYVYEDTRFRVLAALYPTREDAQSVRDQLRAQHALETYVTPIELSGVTLRLTGARGQLDVLEGALGKQSEMISVLQSLSLLLDRQELTHEELIMALAPSREALGTLRLRLQQRFVPPRHAAVEKLMESFASLESFAAALEGDAQAAVATMAAAVKHQAFSMLDDLKEIYGGFQAT